MVYYKMSINSLLTNQPVLNGIKAAIGGGGGGGGVTSVTGTAPVVSSGGVAPVISLATSGVTPASYTNANITVDSLGRVTAAANGTAGGVYTATAPVEVDALTNIISLPIAGVWSATNNVVKGSAADALEWGSDAAGGVYTATAPVEVDALTNIISLPIAGVWSATNNVVKSTAADALEWGSDAAGTGTVTSVASGTGLTGGPITTTGTLSLAKTAVTPAAYTNANITVDAQGRITAAANGTALTSAAPISITDGEIGLVTNAYFTLRSGFLSLYANNEPVQGNVLTFDTVGDGFLKYVEPTSLATVAANGFINKDTNQALQLNIAGTPATGDVLALSATAGQLEWVTPSAGGGATVVAKTQNTIIEGQVPFILGPFPNVISITPVAGDPPVNCNVSFTPASTNALINVVLTIFYTTVSGTDCNFTIRRLAGAFSDLIGSFTFAPSIVAGNGVMSFPMSIYDTGLTIGSATTYEVYGVTSYSDGESQVTQFTISAQINI